VADIEALYSSKPLVVNPDRTVTLTHYQMRIVDPSERQLVFKSGNNATLLSLAGAACSGMSGDTQFGRDLSKALLDKLQRFATDHNTALLDRLQSGCDDAHHYHENKLIIMLNNEIVLSEGTKKTKGRLTSLSCEGEECVRIQIRAKRISSFRIPLFLLQDGSFEIQKCSVTEDSEDFEFIQCDPH
jgi:hypothetical protein